MGVSYALYAHKVIRAAHTHRGQREGQVFFNVLHDVAPELADEVRGTDLDPFHDDTRISGFLVWVYDRLGAAQ